MRLIVFDSHTWYYAKHLLLWAIRLIYCGLIVIALPESHTRWRESLHRGDIEGQKAFGFIIIFFMIGLAAAGAYLLTTSLAHHFMQQWPWRVAALDCVLFLLLGGLLAYAGATAEYQ